MRLRLLLILAVAIVACSGGSTSSADYELGDFFIAGPASVAAGSNTFGASNSGEFPHTIVVTDENGRVVAATDLIQPGESVGLEVDLAPGRYHLTCRIVAQIDDGSLADHYEAGMSLMIDATG